jgi:hypothetical protein
MAKSMKLPKDGGRRDTPMERRRGKKLVHSRYFGISCTQHKEDGEERRVEGRGQTEMS